MNTHRLIRQGARGSLLALALLAGVAAYEKGDTAFSKRNETNLLAEPKPLAEATGSVGFAESLKIEEVRGPWLRVKSKKAAGWVFQGNVATDKPTLAPAAGLTTVSASETDTVAAGRGIAPAAEAFAERHGAGAAQADLEWLDAASDKVDGEAVETFLRDNQLGEYRP